MQDAAAFAAAVASENVFLQFDVQVCFRIVAERAPAMELCSSVPDNMYSDQIHNILNAAWQIAVDTQFPSPSFVVLQISWLSAMPPEQAE